MCVVIGRVQLTQSPAAKRGPLKPPKRPMSAGYPGFIPPTLATLRSAPPGGRDWLHELKFDGYRVQAHIRAGRVKLFTRSGLDWTVKFGKSLAAALAELMVRDAIIDGEVVAEGAGGVPDFSALQDALASGRTDRLNFYAFDLLYLEGLDLRQMPLIERKAALQALIEGAPAVLRFSAHFEEDGERLLRHVCQLGLEGVVSKRRDAPYRSGRGKDWIKCKCSNRQELVVTGYVLSTASNQAIGSLVLGHFQGGELVHAGRVGTGFSNKVAADLFQRLDSMRVSKSPFAKKLSAVDARHVRFVRPELVIEVEFRAWTAEGLVRHASFRGLRDDRPADDVKLEAKEIPSR
jgi:bifunctional non-homologous end joining protein LigD